MSGERKVVISREVGVALDFSKTRKMALSWVIGDLKLGDHLILIHVMPSEFFKKHHGINDTLKSGSALIQLHDYKNPEMMKNYGLQVDMEVVNMLDAIPREKMVRVFAKIYWGDEEKMLRQALEDLKALFDCHGAQNSLSGPAVIFILDCARKVDKV